MQKYKIIILEGHKHAHTNKHVDHKHTHTHILNKIQTFSPDKPGKDVCDPNLEKAKLAKRKKVDFEPTPVPVNSFLSASDAPAQKNLVPV